MDNKLTWTLTALSGCEHVFVAHSLYLRSVQYLTLTLEVLYIDHLFQSLLNLLLAPLFSLRFSHVILLARTGFLSCFCRVLWWHPGDTTPSACSDKDVKGPSLLHQ